MLPGWFPGLCLCISGHSCAAGQNYVLFGAGSSVWGEPGVHSQLDTKTCVPWNCGKQSLTVTSDVRLPRNLRVTYQY